MGGKHFCPVCGEPSGHGTFLCVGCSTLDVEQWTHPKCGGYSRSEVQAAGKTDEKKNLRCNKCKQERTGEEKSNIPSNMCKPKVLLQTMKVQLEDDVKNSLDQVETSGHRRKRRKQDKHKVETDKKEEEDKSLSSLDLYDGSSHEEKTHSKEDYKRSCEKVDAFDPAPATSGIKIEEDHFFGYPDATYGMVKVEKDAEGEQAGSKDTKVFHQTENFFNLMSTILTPTEETADTSSESSTMDDSASVSGMNEGRLNALREEYASLKTQLEKLAHQNSLREQHEALKILYEKEKEEYELKYKQLRGEYDSVVEENTNLKSTIEKHTASAISSHTDQHKWAMQNLQHENEMLTKTLLEKNKREKEFKQKLEILKVQNANLNVKLQEKDKRCNKIAKKLSILTNENSMLKARMDVNMEDKSSYKRKLNTLSEENNLLKVQIYAKNKSKNKYEKKLVSLEDDYKVLKAKFERNGSLGEDVGSYGSSPRL